MHLQPLHASALSLTSFNPLTQDSLKPPTIFGQVSD